MIRPRVTLLLLLCVACAAHQATPGGVADSGSGTPESALEIATVFDARAAGLWSGAATQTVLGNFPLMNFDLRPADGRILFGRTDVDPNDSLRFAFMIETVNGKDTFVFRNGGYFMGILRDTRAALIDHDEAAGRYHFCAESGGCGYLDAVFTFPDAQHLTLDVHVRNQPHLLWQTVRKETRSLPTPFPSDSRSLGNGTAPFPTMPSLKASVSWPGPLAAAADVWLLLSTTACISAGSCNISRGISVAAPAGATSASVSLDQVLPGTYNALAVVDVNRNLATTLLPAHGDSVSNPFATVNVAATGTTTTQLSIVDKL